MADPKYKATNVPLRADQSESLQKAVAMFKKELGVELSRSQMIAFLSNYYINDSGRREAAKTGVPS